MKPILKALRLLTLAMFVPLGAYVAAIAILGHIPSNASWQEPAQGITIYVHTNGVHTGIILPAQADGVDWRGRVRAEDTPSQPAPRWLEFGWGNRDFYINTQTWAQLKFSTAFGAAFGLGDSLIHVDLLNSVAPDRQTRAVRVTPAQYHAIAAAIDASFADKREVVHGYGASDVFYAAKGHYSALHTCNVWTGDVLRGAGVKTALWSPLDGGVMRWLAVGGR